MIVGYDKNGKKLTWGDICKFKIGMTEYEGMIVYEEDQFAYAFEMKGDSFPCVMMSKTNANSIDKIIGVWATNPSEDDFDFYREIAKNN